MNGNTRSYAHGAKRRNNPSQETARTANPKRRGMKAHRRDERRGEAAEPQLAWTRGAERTTTDAPILMRDEQIEPAAWVETLMNRRGDGRTGDLFGGFNGYPEPGRARMEWYRHAGNWSNRLIHADARRAMASLLEHEHMAEAVQTVYFDPPYGMDFDAKLAGDAVTRRAFMDAYERGIHSFLDQIRETATLARELLNERGSFFMQIGDVNVHRCAIVLDEVFGAENRVSTITYSTTGGGSSTREISKAADYILWYARNKEEMLFQPLYEELDVRKWVETQATYAGVELPDGTRRPLTSDERSMPETRIPPEAKLWSMGLLVSQGGAPGKEQGQPFEWEGTTFGPAGLENSQWRVDRRGLERLAETGRLYANKRIRDQDTAEASGLRLIVHRSEMPGRRVSNLWARNISPNDKRYPVQTGNLAIQRCILMTTRPGDLVLDPTCGGGTTAVVAEEWGRRWITIDSSRESIAATRERVLINSYTKHLLTGGPEGFTEENQLRKACGQNALTEQPAGGPNEPATGIVVERKPYVSAASLAYAERPDKTVKRDVTMFVDRPVKARANARIASKFTVESEQLEVFRSVGEILSPREERRQEGWRERILKMLDEKGLCDDNGREYAVEAVTPVKPDGANARAAGRISHHCQLIDRQSGGTRDGVIAIWPQDARVRTENILSGVQTAMSRYKRPDRDLALLVVGADIEGGSSQSLDGGEWQIPVARIEAGTDLHLAESKRKPDEPSALLLVADPMVNIECVRSAADGRPAEYKVRVEGWNQYNPVDGTTDMMTANDVRMWLLDTDYNGSEFCARRVHATNKANGKIERTNRTLLTRMLGGRADDETLNLATGLESAPFEAPTNDRGEVAVRIITASGAVMTWRGPVPDSAAA